MKTLQNKENKDLIVLRHLAGGILFLEIGINLCGLTGYKFN